MKNPILKMLISFFIVVCFFSYADAAEKTVTVSGKITDNATSQPIPQAMVLLFAVSTIAIDMNHLADFLKSVKNIDTVFSNADGSFSDSLKASQDAIGVVCVPLKQGYQMDYHATLLSPTIKTVNFGAIKLEKSDLLPRDTIRVSGIVVDSATGIPLDNCWIVMSGFESWDTAGNTVFTGGNGAFSKQVIIAGTSSTKTLLFFASKTGYENTGGQLQVSGKQVDLGTIKLSKPGAGVKGGSRSLFRAQAVTSMNAYGVNGRLLYAGPVLALHAILRQYGNPAVILLKRNEAVIGKKLLAIMK